VAIGSRARRARRAAVTRSSKSLIRVVARTERERERFAEVDPVLHVMPAMSRVGTSLTSARAQTGWLAGRGAGRK
jgi:hypothetical protein